MPNCYYYDEQRNRCDCYVNENLNELLEENANLRVQLANAIVTVRRVDERCAKLRELVADMWRFTGTACKKYPRLFDPAAQGGQMVQPNMLDSFEQRMAELGIEVGE